MISRRSNSVLLSESHLQTLTTTTTSVISQDVGSHPVKTWGLAPTARLRSAQTLTHARCSPFEQQKGGGSGWFRERTRQHCAQSSCTTTQDGLSLRRPTRRSSRPRSLHGLSASPGVCVPRARSTAPPILPLPQQQLLRGGRRPRAGRGVVH
jgi:hypothetical protein